jgi:DNA-binding NarL/FixJ family response regulator
MDSFGLFRQCLAGYLARCSDIESIHEADNEHALLELAGSEQPDVVLLSVRSKTIDVNGIVDALRSRIPGCRVILVSGYESDLQVEQALKANVDGYVLESDGLEVLRRAISWVRQGGVFYTQSVMHRLSLDNGQFTLSKPRSRAIAALTQRERELLRYLGEGASLKEAASAMGVSYKTADNQKTSLMRKLNIHDRVHLARFAIREGWVAPP